MTFDHTYRISTAPPKSHSYLQRSNQYQGDALNATGWLREASPIYVNRPDSKSGYLPQIDIPSVHHTRRAPPENHFELHADLLERRKYRSPSAPAALHPAYPSEATQRIRREHEARRGTDLEAWATGPLDNFRSKLPSDTMRPVGSMLPNPGTLLPTPLMTSQSLFGPIANKAGHPSKLRSLGQGKPVGLPRHTVHDVVSCSTAAHANFVKTTVGPGARGGDFSTESRTAYTKPPSRALARNNHGSRGIKTEMFGKTEISAWQQPWRDIPGRGG